MTYDQLRSSHRGWAEEYCGSVQNVRREEWTCSIAVGSKAFVEKLKALLGFRARGRKILEGDGGYQVRDESAGYIAFFEAEKEDIGPENTYLWSVKP